MSLLILLLFSYYCPDGYFLNPQVLDDHIVVTDNHCSAIYEIHNTKMTRLITGPGCGRYFSVSPDRGIIGLKLIKENGQQIPALYDRLSEQLIVLHEAQYQVGQVSFSNEGTIAFTIGSELLVMESKDSRKYDLGTYANLAPISPDGKYVVYNDDQDQLWLLEFGTGEKTCITKQGEAGFFYPEWSSNTERIVYSSLDGELNVFDLSNGQTYYLGVGASPCWSADGQYVVFHRIETNGHTITGADLYLAKYDASEQVRLTYTELVFEMDPEFYDHDQKLVYHTFDRREIFIAEFQKKMLLNHEMVYTLARPIKMTDFDHYAYPQARDSIDVPYLHQVYDSPDWFNGHWACAPTTAMMAIAYYNRLPQWDCWCSSPYGHTSHFGRYMCEVYHYREVDYTWQAQDPSGNWASGGYGYMWSGSNRPYTHMAPYLNNHNMTSWRDDSPTFAETIAEVNAGYPYGMCVGLTGAGHLVLAIGQVLNWHTLIFNDPYGNKNTAGYPSYDGKYARYDWPGYNNGYENLNNVYWCVGAQGYWEPATDTIVDDLQFADGFYLHTDPPSSMVYWRDVLTGYNGHMWWTYTTAANNLDTCYAIWTPVLTELGDYYVYAYIPDTNATATAARYYIYFAAGTTSVVIDQSSYADEWVLLGMYVFSTGYGYVYLGDATGTQGQRIAFDALRWIYLGPGVEEEKSSSMNSLITLVSNPIKERIVLNIHGTGKQKLQVTLYDIMGCCVYKSKTDIFDPGLHEMKIDVSHLPSGVYILKTLISGREIISKCVILK